MADSPLENADGPVSPVIKVKGKAIDDKLQIIRVQVDAAIGRLPEAQVTLLSGSIAENSFPEADNADFEVGSPISMAAVYGSGSDQQLFKGLIVAKRLRVTRGAPQLELFCVDKAAGLTHTRKSDFYMKKKDSDVMTQIITDAGLTASVTATTDAERDIVRHTCTDWGFLRSLADRAGHVLTISGGKVTSAPPKTDDAAVLTVTLGMDIISFDARVDAQTTIGGAKAEAWSSDTQKLVSSVGADPVAGAWGTSKPGELAKVLGGREHVLATPLEISAADLKTVADARTLRSALATIQGTCTFQGSAKAVPDAVIELVGMGERFGGKAYIHGVRHTIDDGAWTTETRLGLPDDWNVDSGRFEGESAAGLTAPIHGLQIGKVVQVNDDPDKKLRIKISLPMICTPPPVVWARYAQPYASDAAGIQFMPEVDDEVVVAFLNADPNAPVVVGSLHNAKAPQADTPVQKNMIKGIVTREKMKIEFDEDKKVITVETPGGNVVTLDDENKAITLTDCNKNKIEMNESGITLSSPKDITIKADGKVDVAATQDATMKGMNVTVEAQTSFTGKGGASAEVSASGQTTVKGSMVMIN